jgi:CRP-like cAMP-binding protein
MTASNALLASLSVADLAALKPHLRAVELHSKQLLFDQGARIDHVYFPTGSVISLVLTLSTGQMFEAAMVGKDGVVGAAAALDGRISLSRAIVQLGGPAIICDVNAMATVAFQSQSLISALVRHEQVVYAQAQQSAACMGTHDVQSRLCRWLLRARDLAGTDHLPFTQEFLAEMIGVTRSSVTLVALSLQHAGIIRYSRGKIEIINVEGMQDCACECYAAVKDNYSRLFERE